MKTERYFVGPKLLGDMRDTISRVQGTAYRVNGGHLPGRPESISEGGGGRPSGVRMAVWSATAAWFPISPFSTVATTTQNVQVVKFVFPTATATSVTGTFGYADGGTVLCVNNVAFLGGVSTVAENAQRIVLVTQEAGWWRLVGGSI